MSNTVFIVEKDLKLIEALSQSLSARGFLVEETSNAKNAIDLIRRRKPNCVVLAVDLDQGQNGYILCKNLKKDEDTKNVPVLIIGDPKGFAQHQKLKTRAEDYVGKPVEADTLVEHVGALIGFPNMSTDSSRSSGEILIDEQFTEQPAEASESVDFDDETPGNAAEQPRFSTNEGPTYGYDGEDESAQERTVVGHFPTPEPAPETGSSRLSFLGSSPSSAERGESREFRARVAELEAALVDANERASSFEESLRALEEKSERQQMELEAAKAGGGRSDKDHFALKELLNKRDKELLRIKTELNEKDQELVDLRERETALEQAAVQSSEETVRREAQLKTLQMKTEQQAQDRKRADTQLLAAKEESRSHAAKLTALQTDFEAVQSRLTQLEAEFDPAIEARHAAEAARDASDSALAELRGEHEALKNQLDERTAEADETKQQLEQSHQEQEQLRADIDTQASNYEDQLAALRTEIENANAEVKRADERQQRAHAKTRQLQSLVDRHKDAVHQALGILDEPIADEEEIEVDELG